ncbi:MAG: CPBP family intramembrane metalloprotease [Clostridiales Family XIII bacterium]|jgi:membrane protease YdiL (CAAX protease family)|nr:CPBP family intramembrane metalloprotease [Clostridiales Family XIII bacterium]
MEQILRAIYNDEIITKTAIRSDANILAIALIGYLVITSFASLAIVFFAGFRINGIVYLFASLVGMAFLYICFRKNFPFKEIMEETRSISRGTFFAAFVFIIGMQPVFQLLGQGIEALFALGGKRIVFEPFDPTNGGLLYTVINMVIVGPIVEEVLFRGIVLRALSRHGRNFAVVSGAALFGLYHTNFIQFGHSFVIGLLLGYITFRYSIKWAIVLHCLHNLFMVIIALLNVPWFINYGVLGIFTLSAIGIFIAKRRVVKQWTERQKSKVNAYKFFFRVPYILTYIAIACIMAAMQTSISNL